MKYKKLISFLAFFLAVLSVYGQNPFILKSGEPVTIACGNSEEEVVHTALNLLNRDVESVFSTRIIVTPESKKGMIIVGTIGQSDLIDKAGVDLSPIKASLASLNSSLDNNVALLSLYMLFYLIIYYIISASSSCFRKSFKSFLASDLSTIYVFVIKDNISSSLLFPSQ